MLEARLHFLERAPDSMGTGCTACSIDNGCTTYSRNTCDLGQAGLNRKLDTGRLNLGGRIL